MKFRKLILTALTITGAVTVNAEPRSIDTARSAMTVHVYKAGVFSAFAHDHEISAAGAAGSVDVEGRKVELRINAAALRVHDPKGSDKEREQIQTTMLGPEVLDTEKYKEIGFRSTSVEEAGTGGWKVTGTLTLHGASQPVSVVVHEKEGHYAGSCRFNMTDFGIKPVRIAGGTIRVKDDVQIDFDIQLAAEESARPRR